VAEVTIELIAAGVIALLAAIFGAFRAGRKSAASEGKAKQAEAYQDTRGRMDASTDDFGDDPAAARRFLHERGQRGRDL
jgi:hypothetical protein